MALFWILLRSFILSLIHHMPIEHYKQKKTFGPFVVFQGGVNSVMQFHRIWISNLFLYDKRRLKWKYPSNLTMWYIKMIKMSLPFFHSIPAIHVDVLTPVQPNFFHFEKIKKVLIKNFCNYIWLAIFSQTTWPNQLCY